MDTETAKCYSVVPAAGRSRRMGQSKLLLPWGETTIIDQVLQAWTTSRVCKVVVVVRQDDLQLQAVCDRWPVSVVAVEPEPRDMKASIQIGLRYLIEHANPRDHDRCFIAPADLPTLSSQIIDALIIDALIIDAQIIELLSSENPTTAESEAAKIVVPQFGDRPGHPALLPWPLTREIFALAEDEGINRIVDRCAKRFVPISAEQRVTDVDTLEQYEQLKRKTGTT